MGEFSLCLLVSVPTPRYDSSRWRKNVAAPGRVIYCESNELSITGVCVAKVAREEVTYFIIVSRVMKEERYRYPFQRRLCREGGYYAESHHVRVELAINFGKCRVPACCYLANHI